MMNPCDVEEEPSRTKKLKLFTSSPSGLALLPDEMVLSCLARVSRSDHASLSLVSKWHRSVMGWLWDQWETCRREELMLALGLGRLEIDEIFPGHKLSNSGPNMVIFWDVLAPHKLEIWFAEITLERRKDKGEIRGNIVWSEAVMTLDPPPHQHGCKILYALPLNL
ncbi:hypothetical protein HID58_078785 [Brassica napus]|uniref:BnaCnng56330D protein n=2 Tax=Brassica napus TaxID=3708 RepID=A0A078JQ37_BRANA|nr:hypothetical protein HID58_078785 [Brassica napus]CAF2032672.1 unnamed protein product [Brassica napus]CDY67771.1 BnaCnng56330D [Brassica napus]